MSTPKHEQTELLNEVDRRIAVALVEIGSIIEKRLLVMDRLLAELEKKFAELRAHDQREPYRRFARERDGGEVVDLPGFLPPRRVVN
jgi:hypothetical protein